MMGFIFQLTSIVTMTGVIFCVSNTESDMSDVYQNDAKTSGEALKFGIYEISLTGDGSVANPFDTIATVIFTPPSGQANLKTVYAFYDGENKWKARVYVNETGTWRWSSVSATDKGLDGKTGIFQSIDSKLRGRLLPHPKNPLHWVTENCQWFLNINDTAYFLLSLIDQNGNSISHDDFASYVRDAVDHGITSFRSWVTVGPKGCLEGIEAWKDAVFEDDDCSRLRLNHFRCSDQRLAWLLEHYPDVYIQLIIFPLGTKWSVDESFWEYLTEIQKERVLRYIIARYAAYPQIFWLVVNDAHYGINYPNNNALAREAGEYFRQHDHWQHPISTGHARFVDFYFAEEKWSTYIHLENAYELGATQYEKYHPYARPVFLGEDRYEQDHPELDPIDMRYYQRRLYWAWLLSGGSTNYGGRWWVLHPYNETWKRPIRSPWDREENIFTSQLVGLDSVRHIRDYFIARNIELSDFEPDHGLVTDLDGRTGIQSPKVMRRGTDEYLIYHPNAAADGKEARVDVSRKVRLRLDLRVAHGLLSTEWYRTEDGTAYDGGIIQAGKEIELTSPWIGHDVLLHLAKIPGRE
jgi:hypothetical protein